MSSEPLWAITPYFNPMHWRRRLENFRTFRQRLQVPLVAVELGYDGRFDLEPGDADILLQFPARDVMWQKERLMNLALRAVPPSVSFVACLDGDVVLERDDWPDLARAALDKTPLVQLFTHAWYLPRGHEIDFDLMRRTRSSGAGFAWLREQGRSTLELSNPNWADPSGDPPVTYGLAWGFRRELFAERGFYDAWVIGGGTRVHCFASAGLWNEAADAMQFHPAQREHFRNWAEGFYRDVRDEWGCIEGTVAHLWHGSAAARKYRQRYVDFARFAFDSSADLAPDENGAWRWSSDKPDLHAYVRSYFESRSEDDLPQT